ncbi:MAG: hypothetical protein K6E58_01390 [Eubacterium sp.]|nr:hypothetical protein [Eubacterium sp.]
MKKYLFMFMFALFVVCVYKKEVKALSGSGTSASPYIVKTGSDLKEALSKGNSSWKYIAVRDLTAVTETINVSTGKFRIFASGANQTVRRSQSMSATVNSSTKPLRCIKLDGTTEIELGYAATSYKLTISGSRDSFTDNRQCNEWFYVGSSAKLTICANCTFTNAKNTMKTDEAAPIRAYGVVNVYGEVLNCEGNNGGAIKCISGSVNIYSGAKIHACKSGTEGGAIYGRDFADITMYAGSIYSCLATEEGGGIFCSESVLSLQGGSIYDNTAGKTGGGVFAGNDTALTFGSNGSGPTVSGNYAKNSGGGVRCNGGTDESGGTSTFNGGTITSNKTEVSGGGLSVGKPSSGCPSKIQVSNMTIKNNTASSHGGGVCFSEGVEGKNSDVVEFKNNTITGNISNKYGGGILLNTKLKIEGLTIKNNQGDSGGGIFIATKGVLKMPSSVIENNKANRGTGVSVFGLFELSSAGYVNENNTVYLAKDKHIDITGKLTVSSVLVSYIDPEVTTKGTILVDVTYSGGTAENELYYKGSSVGEANGESFTKKFATKGGRILRTSYRNLSYKSPRYIIISERYEVKYNANSLDPVTNMPDDGIAFWNEIYKVSENIVSRVGLVLSNKKHWNLSADGTGKVYEPGLGTLIESDITLYAIWEELTISSLTMTTVDRYYVVGQKITLNNKELTKKIKVDNDLNIDVPYDIKVTEIDSFSGERLAFGENVKTEDYINTEQENHYRVYLSSSNLDGTVSCTGVMVVHVVEDYFNKTEVRFISYEFIDTLDPRSKWKKQDAYELEKSLKNENKPVYSIDLEKEDLDEIKNSIKNNGHKISHSINAHVSEKIV